jgi:SAM-dependent methyltransferase
MHSVKVCPVCHNQNLVDHIACTDYTVSHETFKLLKCPTCELLITTPRPDDTDLANYYLSDEYISHTKNSKSIVDIIYRISRVFTLNWKYSLTRKYSARKNFTLLDYGCGTGNFLKKCKSEGHTVIGVEPSPKARTLAEENTQSKIESSIDNVTIKPDVITLWHVLEHIPDVNEALNKIRKILNENGTIFIAVPNHESFDGAKYQQQWAGYDVPRHLWHFSKKNMTMLLEKNGFSPEAIIPMKLDSFYVSILSEKYRRTKASLAGFVTGMFTGLKSNIKAGKNNHSSLIYVARKK